jgi:hypothetical protein
VFIIPSRIMTSWITPPWQTEEKCCFKWRNVLEYSIKSKTPPSLFFKVRQRNRCSNNEKRAIFL